MKRIRISIICAFFLAQINLYAQFLGDPIKSDTTSYKFIQDSIDWNTRSNVVGDGIGMPIEIGEKSSDFSYTNTQNTTLFSSLYTGRYTNDVFYRFTITVPMNVTMTHEGSGVSDTYMYLLDSNGTLIVSNDDYNGEGHCSNIYHSFIRRQLAAGTYYVVSEGYSSNGNITTNITGNTSAGYNYPTIPSTYSTSPSTFVGGMGSQFSVSPMGGATYSIPISHGEGRFVAPQEWLDRLFKNGQVATQYCDLNGVPTMDEEYNMNGSYMAIEGITSPDGRVLGKMGHSERWSANKTTATDGSERVFRTAMNIPGNPDQQLFESGVQYFK